MLIDHGFVKAEVRYRRELLKKSYPKSKRLALDEASRVIEVKKDNSDRRRVAA